MGKTLKFMMFSLLLVVIATSVGCGTQAPREEETSELPQAADPFVGTWQLDLEKSTYDPGPGPKNTTRTVEDRGDGFFLMTREGINAQGNQESVQYAYKRDGEDYPIASAEAEVPASISIRSVDAYTEDYTVKYDGKVTATGTTTVSRDGKTSTRTTKSTNDQGQQVSNIEVFERQ